MKDKYIDLIEQSFDFPQDEFTVEDNELNFHDIPLMELIKQYGTPLKITYLPKISQQINRAKRMFNVAMAKVDYKGSYNYCYCTKSSHFSFVLEEAMKNDIHLETSSAYDIHIINALYDGGIIDKDRYIICNGFKRPQYVENIAQLVDDGSKLSVGFLIAIAAVILCGLFMYRTRWGYAIRMIGINQAFSKYSGMKVGTIIVVSQLLGGFLAGVGGGIEMLGRYKTFSWSSLPGYGWTGITIAILAGNNPWFVPPAAFFMAYLSKGCDLMATYAKVPAQLIDIIQGVIFLFFAAEQFLSKYRQKLVVKSAEEEIARKKALEEAKEGGHANA